MGGRRRRDDAGNGGLLRPALAHGALAALFAGVFVAYRAVRVEDGDLRRSILIGGVNAPGAVPPDLPVLGGPGYDGQFYYRLAVDPFHLNGLTEGIRIDTPIRLQRIGYPFLSWLVSGGQRGGVPFALVLVNVACFAALAMVGTALARSYGRSPRWGLLFCLFPGFVVTLSRDLTELLAAVLVLAAVLALRHERPLLAGVVLAAAVVTRETALILAGAVLLARLREVGRGGARPGRADLPWSLPVGAYLLWQAVVRLRVGRLPALAEHDNVSVPFTAPVRAVLTSLHGVQLERLAFAGTAGALLLLGGLVLASQWRARRDGHGASRIVLYAFVLSGLLTVSLSKDVWNGDAAELRTFMDVHLFGVAALLPGRSRYLMAYGAVVLVPFVFAVVHYAQDL